MNDEPENEGDEDFESKFNRWSELSTGFAGIATTLYQCFSAMCAQGFTAEQASDTQGRYVWSGTIHEDDMRGKLVWTKPDGTVLTYTFKGNRKK